MKNKILILIRFVMEFLLMHSRLERFHDDMVLHVQRAEDWSVRMLTMELETGGNVKMQEGSPSDDWLVYYTYLCNIN